MRPFFKIPVAVHSILLILDVSGAHPIALLSLIKRSSNALQSLIKRSSRLFFFRLFLSISLGRLSIAHLSLSYRYSARSSNHRVSADPLDGAAGWFCCTSSLPCRLSTRPSPFVPVRICIRWSLRSSSLRAAYCH
jgi:hypothetical protein